MAISYNDTPNAADRIDETQPLIKTNFSSINTILGVDHASFASSKAGYHKAIHIIDDVPTSVAVGEASIYVDSGNLYIKNGASDAFNITAITTYAGTEVSTYLPSGLIIKFGKTNGAALAGSSWTTITFGAAFPTECFNVQATLKAVNASPSTNQRSSALSINSTLLAASFQIFNSSSTAADCYYYAIGR